MNNSKFMELSSEEMLEIDAGGANQCAKAFFGSVLIGAGWVLCFTGVGAAAGVGVMALGASGVYSACKSKR